MTPVQKIQFIKERIDESAQISPAGPVSITLLPVFENDTEVLLFPLHEQITVLRKLEQEGLISDMKLNKNIATMLVLSTFGSEMLKKTPTPTLSTPASSSYSIKIKDREIWVNNFLIAKPHAVGKNMSFFEYLYENADKLINRDDMPEYVKKDVSGRSFTKVLNALGFTGEILKAFVPKRGKGSVLFKKSVSQEELTDRGVNVEIFIKELGLAHIKIVRSSPV